MQWRSLTRGLASPLKTDIQILVLLVPSGLCRALLRIVSRFSSILLSLCTLVVQSISPASARRRGLALSALVTLLCASFEHRLVR